MNSNQQQRYEQLVAWSTSVLPLPSKQITLLSGDASFRRYYRALTDDGSKVLVDADPAHENTHAFVKVASALLDAGVHVPKVFAVDHGQGFMLLSDLGDELLLSRLDDDSVHRLYSSAIDELVNLQRCDCALPEYNDARLMAEMSLFHEWYLLKALSIELTPDIMAMLNDVYKRLIDEAHRQPKVFVHLDYHSRNLMLLPGDKFGVIDFQDAVVGPVTYDLVSLLKDCYVNWPKELVDAFVLQYMQKAGVDVDQETFMRWFDWMGLQRHLKCVGIFTRLNLRDNKPGYLADIPRVLNYILEVTARYPEFSKLHKFIKEIHQ